MRWPSNRTLGKIAVYTGFGAVTAVMFMRWKLEDRVRNADYYRVALQTLRRHKGAANLLGEPIKDLGVNLAEGEKNYCDGKRAVFEVHLRGSKDRGKMFFTAALSEENKWEIQRLDLELRSQPDKRYLIKKPLATEAAAAVS